VIGDTGKTSQESGKSRWITLTDWSAKLISSGFFVGYTPIASGTFGSLLVIVLYGVSPGFFSLRTVWVFWAALFFLGVWTASRCELFWGKDPSRVVIDEIAGMFLTLSLLPLNIRVVLGGFFLFRFFDIVKPPPARWAERLPAGWGIMADDVVAGIYANVVLQVIVRLML
jgi:phosphatidylglycerophosphatase A